MPDPRKSDMVEGPEAFQRFQDAMAAVVAVPKSALPASPYKKWTPKPAKKAKAKRVTK